MSFDIDFTKTSNVDATPFNHFWGDPSQMSLSSQGLLFGSGPKNIYAAMGLMQSPSGPSAGQGYGVFSFVARHTRASQPGGCYLLLWRADDNWLLSSAPGRITEMDMWETFDNSAHISATTHFWAQSWPGQDGYTEHGIVCDPTKLHVASYVWAKGSLEYFFDETLIFTVTGDTVPDDFADGGCNQCMGCGAETEQSPVGMEITRAKYVAQADIAAAGGVTAILAALVAAANGAAIPPGGGASTSSSGSSGSGETGVPISSPVVALTIASPVNATSASSVTEKLAVTGAPNSTVYVVVVGPASTNYAWQGSPQPVALDASGKGAATVTLGNGDFAKAMLDTSGTGAVNSGSISITPPTVPAAPTPPPPAPPAPTPPPSTAPPAPPTAPPTTAGGTGFRITAASLSGSQLTISFVQVTTGTLEVWAGPNGDALKYAGVFWDNCKPGTYSNQKVNPAIPPGSKVIELRNRVSVAIAKFNLP